MENVEAEAQKLDPEDAEVVARILQGERELFGTLLERYQKRLYWSAWKLLGDADEADDATQEAFVRAYEHLAEYDPQYRFYTWLFRICRNDCINRLRRRRLWNFLSLSRAAESQQEVVIETTGNPSRDVEQREIAEAIDDCLERLSRKYRECFLLRYLEGFSYEEVAGLLKIRMGTVMSRLDRARRQMEECLRAKGITLGE